MTTTITYVGGSSTTGELINMMISHSFLFSANYTVAYSDSSGSGNKSFNFSGLYYRMFLASASASGSGTNEDPKEYLDAVETVLGALYTVTLQSDGFVRIAYSGTGTATLTWGTGETIGRLMGFSGATCVIAAGSYTTATYHPMACIYALGAMDSRDWTSAPTDDSYATTAGGQTYGWGGARHLITKSFGLKYHPRNWTVRTTLNSVISPAWGVNMTWFAIGPVGEAVGTESIARFLLNSKGKQLGILWDGFQTAGSGTSFDCGYFTADCIREAGKFGTSIDNYRQRVSVERLTVTLQSQNGIV